MQAKPGDLLKISGHRVGEPVRHAEILEVRGDRGQPPYFVRWPDGHERCLGPQTADRLLEVDRSSGTECSTEHRIQGRADTPNRTGSSSRHRPAVAKPR